MTLTVYPANLLKGSVHLTASKSYSIRAFFIASCGGSSKIIRPSDSDDVKVAISVAHTLGSQIKIQKNNIYRVVAHRKKINAQRINVRESGTALRFLLPLLSLYFDKAVVIGEGTLRGRPNDHLISSLRHKGMAIKGKGRQESIPIIYDGGHLRGGNTPIDGSISSQFISALLIACPQLCKDTQIIIKGKKLVSGDYVTMTQQILRESGIKIKKFSDRRIKIKGNQKFKGLKNFIVPSDYGLAAFLMGAAAIVSSNVTLRGHLHNGFVQADEAILSLLKKMGVRFKKKARSIIMKGPFHLKGGSFSLKDCPDLVPVMTILALFAKGKTRLYNIRHVRVKESDRIRDLRKELLKIGAKITDKKDEMTIYPQKKYKSNILLNPHHDHRLAMSFCVLGLKLGVKVKDIECVSKSYPKFIKDLKDLGAKIGAVK